MLLTKQQDIYWHVLFLVVKTNVDYQVATFLTKSESTESIVEVLRVIKQWNPTYKFRYFMAVYSKEEITAL